MTNLEGVMEEFFRNLQSDKDHHLGLGDIRLTMDQQEDIIKTIRQAYKDIYVLFEILKSDAKFPTRKHAGDAGMDFYAYGNYIIPSHDFRVVKTAVTVKLPRGFHGLLKPKSKNLHLVGAGVVDNNYQGEILFKLYNILDEDLIIRHCDAIGQMILLTAYSPIPTIGKDIHKEKTVRGDTGGIVEQILEDLGV